MKKVVFGILTTILLIISLNLVFAGPVSEKEITFHITLSQLEQISNGNWRLSFVSIGEFETNGWSFDKYNISAQYMHYKKNCGAKNTFYEQVYEMSPEESQYKGCVINGTYQEKFCFRTTTDKPLCQNLAAYKINDNYQLTFDAFYNSYMWDINRSEQYHHFKTSSCDVVNNTCTITIKKEAEPYNPFMVVLEKLDSAEVYFSSKINIEQTSLFNNETLFACNGDGCDVYVNADISTVQFSLEQPNNLTFSLNSDIQYNVSKSDEIISQQTETNNHSNTQGIIGRFWNWLKEVF